MNVKDVISRFVENRENCNMMRLSLPTGTGKTHALVQFIADEIQNKTGRIIIFLTPLNKNLPLSQLRDELESRGIPERYDEEVLHLPSVTEAALVNGCLMDDLSRSNLVRFVNDKDFTRRLNLSFRQARECIRSERTLEDGERLTDVEYRKVIDSIEDPGRFDMVKERFSELESIIRRRIHSKYKGGPEEVYANLRGDRDMAWVFSMYPAVDMGRRSVFFMSVSKFVYTIDPIVGKPFSIYESDFIDGATVIIDEFDSAKAAMLKAVIPDETDKVEIISAFTSIHAAMNSLDDIRPEVFSHPGSDAQELRYMADDLRTHADRIYETYSLRYVFKTRGDGDPGFMFRDFETWSVSGGNRVEVNAERKVNSIVKAPRSQGYSRVREDEEADPDDDGYYLSRLFSEIEGFFRRFKGMVKKLAGNYVRCKQGEERSILYDSAVGSILSAFLGSDSPYISYFKSRIMFDRAYKKDDEVADNDDCDESVYRNGFSIFSMEDSEDHDLNSHIYQYACYRTPESILLHILMGRDTRLVGVSATAELESVISNFDFHYLRHQTGTFREYAIPDTDMAALDSVVEASQNGYGRVRIVTETIDSSPDSIFVETASLHFRDPVATMGCRDYEEHRYRRIGKAYRYFLEHDDIGSMLCFTTVKPGGTDADRRNLANLFSEIRDKVGYSGDAEFEFLTDNFDARKREVCAKLSAGGKVFVMTSYNTAGAGQNLQYRVPDGMVPIRINDSDYIEDEKDFDAVYLDRPTSIIPDVDPDNWDGLFEGLFTALGFQEIGDMSRKEARTLIRIHFDHYSMGHSSRTIGWLKLDSSKAAIARFIIQAVGRICRTGNKNPSGTIHILFSDDLPRYVSQPIQTYGRWFNPEFRELYDAMSAIRTPRKERAERNRDVEDEASKKLMMRLRTLLENRVVWTRNDMSWWTDIRETTLKHPTMAEYECGNINYTYYIRDRGMNARVRFSQEHEWAPVVIHNGYGSGGEMLSEENSRLPDMMRVPYIRRWFEDRGFATEFEPKGMVMCPILWRDIYRGAVGEEAGLAVFDRMGIPLKPITDGERFERFDFEFADHPDIYVDFKNWAGVPEGMEERRMASKIAFKMDQIGARAAVIANILLPDGNTSPTPYYMDRDLTDGRTVLVIPCIVDPVTKEPYDPAFRMIEEVLGR